jgi:hypothetical protein
MFWFTAQRTLLATLARLTSDPKRFPDGRLEAGDFFVRVRDYPAALREFQAGQQQHPPQNPKRPRVYRKKIAEVLATEGARDQARTMVADLLREDSKIRKPELYMRRCCWRQAKRAR